MSVKDKIVIKNQCRVGIVIPSILFFISLLIMIFYYLNDFSPGAFFIYYMLEWISSSLSGALMLFFLINRKYLQDLMCGEKDSVLCVIERKTKMTYFEAGCGFIGGTGVEMKEFIRYDIIVNNAVYRVDEQFYNKCAEGDCIILYYARYSRYLLGLEVNN